LMQERHKDVGVKRYECVSMRVSTSCKKEIVYRYFLL